MYPRRLHDAAKWACCAYHALTAFYSALQTSSRRSPGVAGMCVATPGEGFSSRECLALFLSGVRWLSVWASSGVASVSLGASSRRWHRWSVAARIVATLARIVSPSPARAHRDADGWRAWRASPRACRRGRQRVACLARCQRVAASVAPVCMGHSPRPMPRHNAHTRCARGSWLRGSRATSTHTGYTGNTAYSLFPSHIGARVELATLHPRPLARPTPLTSASHRPRQRMSGYPHRLSSRLRRCHMRP